MNYFELIHYRITNLLSYPVISISALVVLLFLLFRRPRVFIVLVIFALVTAVMVHIYSKISALGIEHKNPPLIDKIISGKD
jgi:hypothetical protein